MRATRPLYREVLRDAVRIVWRNKHLWPLGFFAGMLLSGSPYDLISRSWTLVLGSPDDAYRSGLAADLYALWNAIAEKGLAGWTWSIPLLVAVLLVLVAVIAWISVVCQGALLADVDALDEKRRPDLQTFFKTGMGKFWPILGINVLLRLAVTLASLLLAAIVIPASRYDGPVLLAATIVGFLVLIPFSYVAINVAFFAAMGIVRHKQGLAESIRDASRLVARHWLVVLETSALVFLADIVATFAIAAGVTVLTVPFFVLFLGALATKSAIVFWLVLTVYLVIVVGAILVAASAVVTFHYAVWALLAERIRTGDVSAKLVRAYHAMRRVFSRK